jgi:hypothetical protein
MADVTYPTNVELAQIAQVKVPRLTRDRAGFQIMPMRDLDAPILMWEQEDDWVGLQQVRGLNGDPPRVRHQGANRFIAQPGYYGEHETVDEQEITMRRGYGTWTGSVSIDDLVMRLQDKLLGRELDRVEYIIWTSYPRAPLPWRQPMVPSCTRIRSRFRPSMLVLRGRPARQPRRWRTSAACSF